MKNFLLQNVVFRADIFPVLWQFLKNAASPAGEPQNHGAKFVRTIFNILCQEENVKFSFAASLRSAAELNGELKEKINFRSYSDKRKFFIHQTNV